jgi:hypothetical protein
MTDRQLLYRSIAGLLLLAVVIGILWITGTLT